MTCLYLLCAKIFCTIWQEEPIEDRHMPQGSAVSLQSKLSANVILPSSMEDCSCRKNAADLAQLLERMQLGLSIGMGKQAAEGQFMWSQANQADADQRAKPKSRVS